MIEIRDHGETVRGRSPQTIARRLYGRRATVELTASRMGDVREANVLTPAYKNLGGYNVEAVWWLDEAAVAAMLADTERKD